MGENRPADIQFRADIEGLRAVAVGLVVLYHAGIPWLPGGYVGVDVFFVISGFLMTALIVRERRRDGRVSLRSFYARRIRRLLPAAVLVLVCTVVAAKMMLPPLAVSGISSAAFATALYVPNMWFAYTGTDYLSDSAPSPLQHYWSLGVEEQFYLVWPAILLVAYALGHGRRKAVGWALVLITLGSFALCVVVTGISQPWAFFALPTRAWELSVGGLIALGWSHLRRVPDAARGAVAWVGLAGLVVMAATYSEAVAFPGWAAAGPVAATAGLVAAGSTGGRVSAGALLSWRPLQWIGRISYSLYLWHWPVLVLPAAAYGDLNGWARAGLVLLAVMLAWLTYRFVENPVRRARPLTRRLSLSYGLGAGLTAVGVAAALVAGILPRLATDTKVAPLTPALAAGAIPTPTVLPANVTPPLESVLDDLPATYDDGCHGDLGDVAPREDCTVGDSGITRSMFLLGDSHGAQWFPALEAVASDDGWQLTSLTKSSCPTVGIVFRQTNLGRAYTECTRWQDAVVAKVQAERPQLVVLGNFSLSYLLQLQGYNTDALQAWTEGLARFIARLPTSTQLMIMGDTPKWAQAPPICLSGHLTDPAACAEPTGDLVRRDIYDAEEKLAAEVGATFVRTDTWLCAAECQALNRNVVIYRDEHHITATMAGMLADRMRNAIGATSTT